MEVVKQFSILTILVGNSLLVGCQTKHTENITELKFSSRDNSIIFKSIIDENGNIIRRDSTTLNISFECNYDYSFQELAGDEFFTDCGAYNLKNRKSIKFDNLIPIRHSKEKIVFYDVKKRSIASFDARTAMLITNKEISNLELQIFNNKPAFENLSPDFKHLIVLSSDNQTVRSSAPFDLILKNLYDASENKIVKSVFGSKISDDSNAKSIPKIIWINNTQFLYSTHTSEEKDSSCSIQKYDVETNKISFVGKIENLPESSVNYYFTQDDMGKVFYSDDNRMFSIDYMKNEIKANAAYSLGNRFFVSFQKDGLSLKFKDKTIGDIPKGSNFALDKQFYRTEPNAIILKYKQQIESVNVEWKDVCKIWRSDKEWIEVPLRNEVHLLSLQTLDK